MADNDLPARLVQPETLALVPRNLANLEAVDSDGLVAKLADNDSQRLHVIEQDGNTRVSPIYIGRFGLLCYVEFNPHKELDGIHIDGYLLIPKAIWDYLGTEAGFQELFKARHFNFHPLKPNDRVHYIDGGGHHEMVLADNGGTYMAAYYCEKALSTSFPEDVKGHLTTMIERLIKFEVELAPIISRAPKTDVSLPKLTELPKGTRYLLT